MGSWCLVNLTVRKGKSITSVMVGDALRDSSGDELTWLAMHMTCFGCSPENKSLYMCRNPKLGADS